MATLLLTDDGRVNGDELAQDLPTLRTWLREGWAILFSHPDDFVSYDIESDRLVSVIGKAYTDRGVRPMAVTTDPFASSRGWVAGVSGDERVRLDESGTPGADIVDLRTRTLAEHLRSLDRRFVVLVDSLLRRRKTLVYERSANLPSPLEFLAYVDCMRKGAGSTGDANDLAPSRTHAHDSRARWTENHHPLRQQRGRRSFNGYAYSRH